MGGSTSSSQFRVPAARAANTSRSHYRRPRGRDNPSPGLRPGEGLSFLVSQELAGDLEIALLIRVRHAGSVHPLSGPLHRLGQILGIFDHAGINQALTVRSDSEAL